MSTKISNRKGKYQFAGKLSDFQKLEANPNSFVKYEQDKYTAYQNYLYKRALYSNFIFKTLFPKAPLTDWLINNDQIDDKFKNTLTFTDLGISKDDIVKVFIDEGILRPDFMDVTTNPNKLPRLKYQSK